MQYNTYSSNSCVFSFNKQQLKMGRAFSLELANFFCKVPDSKYFRFCELCSLCHKFSSLPLQHKSSHRQYICKQRSMALFAILQKQATGQIWTRVCLSLQNYKEIQGHAALFFFFQYSFFHLILISVKYKRMLKYKTAEALPYR